ncbi:predicted protein [Sclerotinia sclerotiorum 1980 UF-70]|uniref:Uncharacterized protein n=1 Tax=Sclerotinia sclerotiorum (strain ATCC 18683 / 1980 / Ss-1) TaxID=665079 RepID=A7ER23_SCLS1|nr:predicted protein [Sclerotinia sclerotiorum 1980 UF-70]EDN91915.1 predicted protein [Sclerotinia sclerotiorum 1980 UF-70]
MAEALGVASSAVQLDDGILKLKYFWNAVKDAPEEMLYILDELDTTHLLLKEIEDSLGSQTMSPAAARSLRLCQKGMDTLNNTVKELGKEMQKRKKWSGVKVVMRKELLEKMKKRLEKANSLMTMAHQYYIASLSKSTYNEQVRLAMLQFSEFVGIRNALHSLTSAGSTCMAQQQTAEANTSSSSDTLTGKDAISISVARKALPGHQKILHAKLRLPFFSGVWGLCGYRQSISGWKFTPKTYNVVGYRAPIMVAASSGDVAKMQELFQTHRASPFDVDPKGHTLLHKAAMSDHSYQSCQLLVDQGADPNAQNRSSRDEQCLRDIHDLIDDIIFSGSKVYYFGATFEGFPRSFLDQLISGITFYIHQGRADPIYPKEFYVFFEPNIRYIFGMWLDKLVSAGVDLIRYGQWEEKHCHEVHYCTSSMGQSSEGGVVDMCGWENT